MKATLILAAVLAVVPPAAACSFCGGNIATQSTLRERFVQSNAVVLGTMKNPKLLNEQGSGTTEFHFTQILKTDPLLAKIPAVTIARYLPTAEKAPLPYLIYFDTTRGKIDSIYGIPTSEAVVKYITAIAALDPKQPLKRLALSFEYLDSPVADIAEDAFLEFAKASDAEITAAKSLLSPVKLQHLLLDPKTPPYRLGVFAMMLGQCGDATHAETFTKLLTPPLSEAVAGNLGGILAGYTLLDARAGWTAIRALVLDKKQPFAQRLSAMQAVQYFQSVRGKEYRTVILDTCKLLLPDPELADLVIDDLRRWGWCDLTSDILALYGKPTHSAPIFKKGIIRYALSCTEPAARNFVTEVRKTEPKLVADVEDGLKLLAAPGR